MKAIAFIGAGPLTAMVRCRHATSVANQTEKETFVVAVPYLLGACAYFILFQVTMQIGFKHRRCTTI
jgi:ABC-type amino acid transport system permease subunit